MKKLILTTCICLLTITGLKAQWLINAGPVATFNHAPFFKAFRDAYNIQNAGTMTNKLGNPALGYGYQAGLGYRLLHMQSSIAYSRFHSGTHAAFSNNAKRIIDYDYECFIVNAGGFFEKNENQFSIDFGMVLSGVDQYSYVVLPNKEISYTYGAISQLNHWLNLGMNFRLGYDRSINDYLSWHTGLTYYFINNDKEFAPGIELSNTRATLTFKGIEFTTGIMLRLGERIM